MTIRDPQKGTKEKPNEQHGVYWVDAKGQRIPIPVIPVNHGNYSQCRFDVRGYPLLGDCYFKDGAFVHALPEDIRVCRTGLQARDRQGRFYFGPQYRGEKPLLVFDPGVPAADKAPAWKTWPAATWIHVDARGRVWAHFPGHQNAHEPPDADEAEDPKAGPRTAGVYRFVNGAWARLRHGEEPMAGAVLYAVAREAFIVRGVLLYKERFWLIGPGDTEVEAAADASELMSNNREKIIQCFARSFTNEDEGLKVVVDAGQRIWFIIPQPNNLVLGQRLCVMDGAKEEVDLTGKFSKKFHTLEAPLSLMLAPDRESVFLNVNHYGGKNPELVPLRAAWRDGAPIVYKLSLLSR